MKKINLREVYPFYENDCFVMVDDEIAEIFEESKRKELNYQRKVYWIMPIIPRIEMMESSIRQFLFPCHLMKSMSGR